uniref:Heparanase 2 (Inactive) n=1 Tax=Rousettus aegyptiacus TaxID=9407 RepID=A0A7J8G903_ROUAE|nr:heparanase 2 (inactive) [Rousettus aegyptiacus]
MQLPGNSSCYIDGRVVKVMDFLKTRLLDTLSDQIRKIQKVSKSLLGRRGVSLGERQGKITGSQLDVSTVEIRVEK